MIAYELRLSFLHFLKVVKPTNQTKMVSRNSPPHPLPRCDRDHIWPMKPKIFAIWSFIKSLPHFRLVDQTRFLLSSYSLLSVLSPCRPSTAATVPAETRLQFQGDVTTSSQRREGALGSRVLPGVHPADCPLHPVSQGLVGSEQPALSGLGQEGRTLFTALLFWAYPSISFLVLTCLE